MAFSSTTQWDVRTTGSDSNGGGWDSASSGTNYAQQDSPQVTYTDLVIDGTTNTKCTSAGTPFTSLHVGNIINITSGTGFSVQRVQIVSVTSAVATCDKSLGTLSSTGGNGKLGGGCLTINTPNLLTVSGNTINIKAATYTQTVNLAIPTAASTVTWTGYGTTWADGGTRPLITTATNSVELLSTSSNGSGFHTFDNLSLSHTAGTRASGIAQLINNGPSQTWLFRTCLFDGFSTGINADNVGSHGYVGNIIIITVEVKNSNTNAVNFSQSGILLRALGCYIHNNTGIGLYGSSGTVLIERCIVASNTSYGTYGGGSQVQFISNSTFYANGNAAVSSGNSSGKTIVYNSIFYGQTSGGGILFTGGNPGSAESRNNAFGSNTGGNSGWPSSPGDVALSANPFTNAAGGDFSLNSTAGGGTACKGAGFPGAFAGGTSTGTLDIGAVQSGSGGGVTAHPFVNPGMNGGMNG